MSILLIVFHQFSAPFLVHLGRPALLLHLVLAGRVAAEGTGEAVAVVVVTVYAVLAVLRETGRIGSYGCSSRATNGTRLVKVERRLRSLASNHRHVVSGRHLSLARAACIVRAMHSIDLR